MKLTRDFLINALAQAEFFYGGVLLDRHDAQAWSQCQRGGDVAVSIDSRTVQSGECFVALKGPQFDGHDFIIEALKKRVSAVVLSDLWKANMLALPIDLAAHTLFIVVSDTIGALVGLAKAWRAFLRCPVIAITGSVGKTSTKEMLSLIVKKASINAYVSYKNYNNLFGVCYNILRIPESIELAIIEVGINECGEMIQLADIVRPTIALITNIGHSHLEGLGNSLRVVAYEKRQLFAFLKPADVGIVCGDQALLTDISYPHPIAKFGTKVKNQVQARKISFSCDAQGVWATDFVMQWYGTRVPVRLYGNHKGSVYNALAASTVAYFLHIPLQTVLEGLAEYSGTEQRFEMKKIKNSRGVLFSDCYNANPESMKAALVAFSQLPCKEQKVAVLGDMLELGKREEYWHRQIGRLIAKIEGVDRLILVGKRAQMISQTTPDRITVECVDDWRGAQQRLERIVHDAPAAVLVKASHGMRLDYMVNAVAEE